MAPPKEPAAEQDSKPADRSTPTDVRSKPARKQPDPTVSLTESTKTPPKPAGSSKAPADTTEPSGPELVLVIDPERLVLTVGETRPIVAYACPKDAADPGPDEQYGTADDPCSTRADVEWSLKDPDVADIVEAEGKRTRLSATRAIAATKVIAKAGDLTARVELKIKPAATPEPAPTVETPASQPQPEAAGPADGAAQPGARPPVESRPASERGADTGTDTGEPAG